jgi:hypothetical protein
MADRDLTSKTLTRGTEFLDAETRGQNRAERPQSVSKDGKSGTIPTKIPTETAYSEAALGFAVWVGLGGGGDMDRTYDPRLRISAPLW